MLEKVTWPVVVVIIAVLTAVVILSLNHADVSVIGNMLILMGLGGGLGVLAGIKNNVNGNLQQLVVMIGQAMDRLAASQPPPVETPPEKETV